MRERLKLLALAATLSLVTCLFMQADALSASLGDAKGNPKAIGSQVGAIKKVLDGIVASDEVVLTNYRTEIERYQEDPSDANRDAMDSAYLAVVTQGIASTGVLGPEVRALSGKLPSLSRLVENQLLVAQHRLVDLETKLRMIELSLGDDDSGVLPIGNGLNDPSILEASLKRKVYETQIAGCKRHVGNLENQVVTLQKVKKQCNHIAASYSAINRFLEEAREQHQLGMELARNASRLKEVADLVQSAKSTAAGLVTAWVQAFDAPSQLVATR